MLLYASPVTYRTDSNRGHTSDMYILHCKMVILICQRVSIMVTHLSVVRHFPQVRLDWVASRRLS